MSLSKQALTKQNIDAFFDALASRYEALGGEDPITLVIVGGAAILSRFEYRLSTLDIDAIYTKSQTF